MANDSRESRLQVSRRGFLKAGGVGAAMAMGSLGAIPFSASRAAAQQAWDEEFDIVVAGSGCAGLVAAITAKALGSSTVVLEKGAYVGGTSLVSGGGFFIPNSRQMVELGYDDPREERLKYMARYSWPHLYNPDAENYGLTQHDFDMISTFYDTARESIEFLEENGVSEYQVQWIGGSVPAIPNVDYMDHFEEAIPKVAGTLQPLDDDGNPGGGSLMIGNYQRWLENNGVEIRLNNRVERVVVDDSGAVIGVEVSVSNGSEATPSASGTIAIKANKGVIFGTGGFVKDREMMHHLMPFPHIGGCGAPTNEGDFQKIAMSLGAKQGNLHNVYRNEGIYENGVADPNAYNCIWFHKGDSMLQVNGKGKRFVNERRNYQDRPMAQGYWDPNDGTFPNAISYLIYDQRVAENWAGNFPYPQLDADAPYVIKADTLEELGAAIRERVESLPSIGPSMRPYPEFEANLVAEVARFNEFAANEKDEDFRRGEFLYDEGWQTAPSNPEPTIEWPSEGQTVKSLYPLSETGPYYAIITAPAAVDTNGGPIINPDGQVLSYSGGPIAGLYGSGNAVASPGVNAYWVGGMTLGNAHVWSYRAARHAHDSAPR
jgi:succinate dehydrogenase/fumarate reductase flavoprotein subunit